MVSERLISSSQVPLLVFEQRGRSDEPLVVFLPGAIHLARISYGHGSANPQDFLAHWWKEVGHSFLAVSYPLEVSEPVFDNVDPDLGLVAYARAVAAHIDTVVAEWGLERSVIVLGWSAAGNIAPRLTAELADRGVALELFVALAASPPLPGIVFGSRERASDWATAAGSFTSSGLLAHAGLRSFLPELKRTDERYGRTVIAEADYATNYLGNMPVNLFPGLDAQRLDGQLVVGHEGPLAESRGAVWSDYPVVAVLQPTWPTDARHVLTDRHNWGLVQTNMFATTRLDETTASALSDAEWRQCAALVGSAPEKLTRVIEGGHMFFLGVDGARQTVELVRELLIEARTIVAELDRLLGR
ncbi:MAG: hypothetical protein ACRBK7_25480 [Acidimicrobiales bacterium]